MIVVFQVREDTTTNWTSSNPELKPGELALDTTTKKFKIGEQKPGEAVGVGKKWSEITVLYGPESGGAGSFVTLEEAEKLDAKVTIVETAAASYTLQKLTGGAISNEGCLIKGTAGSGVQKIIVPKNTTTFSVGAVFEIVEWGTAPGTSAQLVVEGAAGVSLRKASATALIEAREQYSGITLTKMGLEEWWASGDIK